MEGVLGPLVEGAEAESYWEGQMHQLRGQTSTQPVGRLQWEQEDQVCGD